MMRLNVTEVQGWWASSCWVECATQLKKHTEPPTLHYANISSVFILLLKLGGAPGEILQPQQLSCARAHTHTHTQSINLSMHVQQSPPPPPPSPPHTNNVSITQSNTHQNQLQQNNAQWPYVSFGPSGWLNACLWFFVYINWTAAQHFRGHVVGRSVDHGRVNIYTHLHINIILLQCLCVCVVCVCVWV